jgi:hypothetical protein
MNHKEKQLLAFIFIAFGILSLISFCSCNKNDDGTPVKYNTIYLYNSTNKQISINIKGTSSNIVMDFDCKELSYPAFINGVYIYGKSYEAWDYKTSVLIQSGTIKCYDTIR